MEPYTPPSLRKGYLRRFATWLAAYLTALAVYVSYQVWEIGGAAVLAADNLWLLARYAGGVVVLAAVVACLPELPMTNRSRPE